MPGQNRWAGKVNPADLTGMRQRQLIAKAEADKAAREMTADELAKIRHDSYTSGHATGYELGVEAGLDAATEALLSLPEEALLAKRAEFQAEFGGDDEPGDVEHQDVA